MPTGAKMPHFSGDRRLDTQLRQTISTFVAAVNGMRRMADELITDA